MGFTGSWCAEWGPVEATPVRGNENCHWWSCSESWASSAHAGFGYFLSCTPVLFTQQPYILLMAQARVGVVLLKKTLFWDPRPILQPARSSVSLR